MTGTQEFRSYGLDYKHSPAVAQLNRYLSAKRQMIREAIEVRSERTDDNGRKLIEIQAQLRLLSDIDRELSLSQLSNDTTTDDQLVPDSTTDRK